MLVHGPGVPPEPVKYGVSVPIGFKSFIEIEEIRQNLASPPHGNCTLNTQLQQLENFPTYSVSGCMLECYSRAIALYCNCSASTIPIVKKGKYQLNLKDCTKNQTIQHRYRNSQENRLQTKILYIVATNLRR